MAVHGSVSRPLVSGRLTLSAKRSRGNNQTYIYIYIRKKWRDLDKKWVFLQMGAKSSTKHVSGGKELASPWVLTTYFGCGNAGMPIHTLTQEPGTCNEFIRKIADAIWELRVLIRHGEPFKAGGPVGICSRTSLMQVHLWYMPYELQRPYAKQGLLSVCKGLQPLLSSSPAQTIRTVFTHIYLYNPPYLS